MANLTAKINLKQLGDGCIVKNAQGKIFLDVSKIKNVFIGKDDNVYVDLYISERREIDRDGNTHAISISKKKEQKEEKTIYVGSAKDWAAAGHAAKEQSTAQVAPAPAQKPSPAPASQTEVDDLPF